MEDDACSRNRTAFHVFSSLRRRSPFVLRALSSSVRPRSLNPFRVLITHRNFRLFWSGQTLSLVGSWMQTMAQGWLALELSNSALVVGLVSAIGSVPILLLSLHAGVLVDRHDKRRIVTIAQSLMLAESVVLWWLVWSGHITIGWLLGLAAFNGFLSSIEIPARQAMIVELVSREDMQGAIALNASGFNLARIIGPGIAALVISAMGLAWCFAFNAMSYAAVLVGLFALRLPPWRPREDRLSPVAAMREGLRYVRTTKELDVVIRLVAVVSVFGIPYLTLMPVVARDMLGIGASGYGILLACVGIGGLAGALALASLAQRANRGVVLYAACIAHPLLLIAFAFTRSVGLARVVLLAAGFTMILTNATANGILQHIVPDEFRGRLMSLYSLIVVGLSQVVGAFAAGAVARAVGVDWAIGGGAAIMLLYAVRTFNRHPDLKRV